MDLMAKMLYFSLSSYSFFRGFCGFRTNPFVEPLIPCDDNGGFYITCRLVSDNEPERRVWKMTTRTRPDRGELLYHAPVNLTVDETSSDPSVSYHSSTVLGVSLRAGSTNGTGSALKRFRRALSSRDDDE
jgi:hypothetical protein